MKRFFAILITGLLCLILFGCGQKKAEPAATPTPSASPSPTAAISGDVTKKIEIACGEGKQLLEKRKYEEARKKFDQVLALDNRNVSALEGKVQSLMGQKKWNEALEVLNYFLSLNPTHRGQQWHGYLYRSTVNLQLGNMKGYMEDRIRAESFPENKFLTNIKLGRALTMAKKYKEAHVLLNNMLKSAADSKEKSDILIAMGHTSVHEKRLDEAEKYFREALKTGNDTAQCYYMLMTIYKEKAQAKKALELYEEYRKIDPDEILLSKMGTGMRAQQYATLGSIYMDLGRLEEADKYLSMSLSINPDESDVLRTRTMVLVFMGKEDEARKIAQEWQKNNPPPPGEADEFSDYALVYLMLDKTDKAMEYADNAIAKMPDKPYNYAVRALINLKRKDKKAFTKDMQTFRKSASPDEVNYVNQIMEKYGE